jgi:hypothetical protein
MGRYWRPRQVRAWTPPQGAGWPPIFLILATQWGLSFQETTALWGALSVAVWSDATRWRAALRDFAPTSDAATQAFLAQTCYPRHVVAVLEGLAAEGVLPRAVASQLQCRVIETPIQPDDWRQWAPPEGEEAVQALDLCVYIERYWS